MLTDREITKKLMEKKREKEKIKNLKEKGLCMYEGEIIPVMEARKRCGVKGAEHWKGAVAGVFPRKMIEFMGAEHGVKGKEDGVKGKEHGVKWRKEDGVKGAEHGWKGAEHGKKCPKEVQGSEYIWSSYISSILHLVNYHIWAFYISSILHFVN